jgi:hypothetical protein
MLPSLSYKITTEHFRTRFAWEAHLRRNLALTPQARMNLRQPVLAYAETAWAGPRAL